jgi:hypothetical protein
MQTLPRVSQRESLPVTVTARPTIFVDHAHIARTHPLPAGWGSQERNPALCCSDQEGMRERAHDGGRSLATRQLPLVRGHGACPASTLHRQSRNLQLHTSMASSAPLDTVALLYLELAAMSSYPAAQRCALRMNLVQTVTCVSAEQSRAEQRHGGARQSLSIGVLLSRVLSRYSRSWAVPGSRLTLSLARFLFACSAHDASDRAGHQAPSS